MPESIKPHERFCNIAIVMRRPSPLRDLRSRSREESGSISMHFVREALADLRLKSPDKVEAALKEAGISREILNSDKARISPRIFGNLWRLTAESFDDEFFGMDRHPMKAGSFVLLCRSLISSATLEQALKRATRFLRLVLDDMEAHLETVNGNAVIHVTERKKHPRAFAAGTLLVILHGLACWLVGRRIPLSETGFRSPPPPFLEEWKVTFCQEIAFSQARTYLAFPGDYLVLPNIRHEKSLNEFLNEAPSNFLVKYRHSDGMTAQVRRLIKDRPPQDWPTLDQLAREMNVSASTLRRRLVREGQSYRALCEEFRYDLAIDYLGQAGLTVEQIAHELGFAEASAFHRAFRHWAGVSPGAYRRSLVAKRPPEVPAPPPVS